MSPAEVVEAYLATQMAARQGYLRDFMKSVRPDKQRAFCCPAHGPKMTYLHTIQHKSRRTLNCTEACDQHIVEVPIEFLHE